MTAADRAKAAEPITDALDYVGAFDHSNDEQRDRDYVDAAVAAALAAARADARREQQLWDRGRVEDYAATVHVELTPGDDLGDAVNDLYHAARADADARWTAAVEGLAEELADRQVHAVVEASHHADNSLWRATWVGKATAFGIAAARLRGLTTSSEEE